MIDPNTLRTAFSRYMTGVTVVTTRSASGEPVGFTANSFTSVSLAPPMLLVCPGRHLSSFEQFAQTEYFAVNILSEGQEGISNIFARRVADRFTKVDWTADTQGCPLISGRAAGFSCRVAQRVEAGDHLILIGEVSGFDDAGLRGLGYCNSGYFSLSNERQADTPSRNSESRAQIILERDGTILMTKDHTLPGATLREGVGARSALKDELSRIGIETQLGPVYAIYDQPDGTRLTVLRGQVTADSGDLIAIPVETLEHRDWPDSALGEMLRRFAQEYRNQNFGLYVGDASHGEIHDMGG